MPCYFPLQAFYSLRPDGKKDVKFSNAGAKLFQSGVKQVGASNLSIPCGQCMGCRLERSRQWATRMVHESKCYDHNCFVTLTFDDKHLAKMCPGGSLDRVHVQNFMKSLRSVFVPPCPDGFDKDEWIREFCVRVFYCGEYGEKLGRPHYHLCLFNFDFPDKVRAFYSNGNWLYTSNILSELWPFGNAYVGAFSFESAAYVARYVTKKVTGPLAEDHYNGRVPEFCGMSLKPGIGQRWFEKFAKSDLFPHDDVIVRGAKCKPPRYYDILRERVDPEGFAKAKEARRLLGESKADDNTMDRLATKLKCHEARFKLLIRKLEKF